MYQSYQHQKKEQPQLISHSYNQHYHQHSGHHPQYNYSSPHQQQQHLSIQQNFLPMSGSIHPAIRTQPSPHHFSQAHHQHPALQQKPHHLQAHSAHIPLSDQPHPQQLQQQLGTHTGQQSQLQTALHNATVMMQQQRQQQHALAQLNPTSLAQTPSRHSKQSFDVSKWLNSINIWDEKYDYVMHDDHWLTSKWSADCKQCQAAAARLSANETYDLNETFESALDETSSDQKNHLQHQQVMKTQQLQEKISKIPKRNHFN